MNEAIVEDLHWFNECLLLRQLGYVLMCERDGREYVVNDIRLMEVDGDEPNLECLTLQGWSQPSTCWGVLRSKPVVEEPVDRQPGLFG